eukprot:TRINITY_DN8220_c0_g1_i3.p1 TRINITY_DN8220_c0_g1~~TRINITY_DN8220_c0_g1_i3.p1  ORF type:complete len:1158 (+),score=253.94 TRINITY_DN8220_c0_g1_i3:106-3474(+)
MADVGIVTVVEPPPPLSPRTPQTKSSEAELRSPLGRSGAGVGGSIANGAIVSPGCGAAATAGASGSAAVAAAAGPQTPQKRRQPRSERRKTPQSANQAKTPPTSASQATTLSPLATTPSTSHTWGSPSRPGIVEDADVDEDDPDLVVSLGGEFFADDDEDVDILVEEDRGLAGKAAGSSVPCGVQSGRGSSRGRGGASSNSGGKGGKQQHGRGGGGGGGAYAGVRGPPPPPSGSLKALPSDHVQRFLQLVQDQDHAEALKALRKVRRAVKGRGCSKEAFGGMRALLHHLLEGYASAGQLGQALELLGDMKRGSEARLVSSAAFNAVLRGLLARGSIDEARFVVRQEMPRLGVSPNEASLNLLMDTAARAGKVDEAWDVLEEMQNRGLRADKYTVSILTKAISDRGCDKRRAPRGVLLVERFLGSQPEDVDEVLVNSLLDVFCRMGDMPRLESTLQKMREYGIKGSAVTYGTIVKAYGRTGNIEKVLQAWKEMERIGLEANNVTYGCMLDACVKCGHIEKAINVFEIMKAQGLHRNTILYATLIKGFAKSKDPLAARNLHREMVAEGVPCNAVVFNSLIDACVRANDLHAAAEVLQQMTIAGVRPDLITFSTLIKGYCSNGELNRAMRLADELQSRKLECDEIVYNSLLEGCVKASDLPLGMRLFTEMKAKGVKPSSVTFSILVKLLSRAGRLDLALHLVATEMRDLHGVSPTRMVWSCLVNCCVKAKDLARAVLVLDNLDRDGCGGVGGGGGSRASMYATVIEGCLAQGEVGHALTLCERAYSRATPEEGGRTGLLSTDLLRRTFEAAGSRGSEATNSRAVLEMIGNRLGDQVRNVLEDSLSRGSRRRSPRNRDRGNGEARSPTRATASAISAETAGGNCTSGSAASAGTVGLSPPPPSAASAWLGGTAPGAIQQWQMPPFAQATPPMPYSEACQGAGMPGCMPQFPGAWDPTIVAAAAAAAAAAAVAAANPWAWQLGGADLYGGAVPGPFGVGGYPGLDPYSSLAAGWPSVQQSWQEGHANATTVPLPAPTPANVEEQRSPEPAPSCSTPNGTNSSGKALKQTPSTTAGPSPGLSKSALAEDDNDEDTVSLSLRLFDGEEHNKPCAEVSVNSVIDRPPGLG